ncbi:MAG: hypothetical protein L0170_03610 [Acidobacteria bacterium]|nr:hypothetical protein [Acidobacteriota bacterium]
MEMGNAKPGTIATVWLDPRILIPCDPPTDIQKLLGLIATFLKRGGGETVPAILTMSLATDESRLLVLDGNHRAGAAFAACRRLRGKVCRSAQDLEAVGQGTAAGEARRLGFAGCKESFLRIAFASGWYAGGFQEYLRLAGLRPSSNKPYEATKVLLPER